MTDYYIFGTYYSGNSNLDRNFTADRANAKWRSQVTLLNNAPDAVANNGEYYLLDNLVYIVAISDLDYQLRRTDPVGDGFRIKCNIGGNRPDIVYLGASAVRTFAHVDIDFTPAGNPNPNPFPRPTPFPKLLTGLEYLKFAEARLELGYDYGAVGGQSFETAITEVADDREQRNINRYLPLGRWQLGDRLYADSESDSLAEVKYLREFHNERQGSAAGFRFKDWADYKGTGEVIAVGDGVKTDFQLRKAYRAGNAVTYRPIQKPVVGTVDILVNGVNVIYTPNHGWDVDHVTGVVRNNTPLTNGATLSCNFEFDVPVWFEADEIGFKLEGYDPDMEASIYRLESVFVVEGRIPLTLPWVIPPLSEITEELDLGIVYDTIEKYSHSTNKLELGSGYSRREAKREDSRILFDLGGRNYDRAEVDKILGYFYCARGKAAEFPFVNLGKNYKVRFDTDNLNLKFEAANTDDALFNLSGLKIQIDEEIIKQEIIDYSLLYGHYTFLETAPNSRLYNYHVYGQNFLNNSTTNPVETVTANTEVSSVYAINTSTQFQSINTINISTQNNSGLTIGLNYKTTGTDNSFRPIFTANTLPTLKLSYKVLGDSWELVFASQIILGVKLSGYSFIPSEYNSIYLTIDFNQSTHYLYINGERLVSFTFTNSPALSSGVYIFGQVNPFARYSSIQIWKKALTQAEITQLHPGGKKIKFRSATLKDSAVGKPLIITAEDGGYGYKSDSTGALTNLIPNNNVNLPTINNGYLQFSGTNNNLTFDATTTDNPLYLFFVFKSSATTQQDSTFKSLIFFTYVNATITTVKISFYIIFDKLYIDRATNNVGLKQFTYSIPVNFLNGENQEVCFYITSEVLYINGQLISSISVINYPSSNNYSSVNNCSLGFRASGFSTNIAPFDVALFLPIFTTQDFASVPYTNSSGIAYNIARLFYQMGFKKSLTALEPPNNPRLLAGDYPI